MASSLKKTEVKDESVCRTCLSKGIVLLSVFDVYRGSITLDNIISAITGVKISQRDGLPSTICSECKEKAEIAFEFKERSREADNKLRGLCKTEKTEFSVVDIPVYQPQGVKCEQLNHDDDNHDFLDVDFSLTTNEPEGCRDIEPVKKEHQDAVSSCKMDYDLNESTNDFEKKKCIKVEFEDTVSTYCPLCGTSFDGADTLTKHMWSHHAELMGPKKRGRTKKIVTSTILSKLSENGFFLKQVQGKKFDCVLCKLQCSTKEDLASHMAKHKDTKVFCCSMCKKMYTKKKSFDQHMCTVKGDNCDINMVTEIMLHQLLEPNCDVDSVLKICSFCNRVLFSDDELATHIDAEHPEHSLRCNLCAKGFMTLKSASRHRSMCKQVDRKHVCSTCGLKFAFEISLNKHILRHHEGQSVSVTFLDSRAKEDSPPAQAQTNEPPAQYQCDTCNRCFPKKESLAKHTKAHMPVEKLFECDVCKKKFSRKDNLRSHKKIHEPNREKPLNNCLCLYCGRGFSNSSNLIVHMRRHTGEKPYKCDFCGKGFPRSSDLQCHRRSHTGEKPCVCRVCGKAFSRSNKLSRHMRVHTGQKPYKCTYCEKAFSQSNDLTLHIRRHTGDKPYICEVCGDRFIQGTALANHRRVHGHFPPSTSEASPHVPPHAPLHAPLHAPPHAPSHVLTYAATAAVHTITQSH